MIKIEKTKNGSELVISLEGRLDTVTAPRLEEELKSSVQGIISLVFDLKDLQYISSAGLRVLLSAQKTMNRQGTMAVRNVSDGVREIFDVTGFSDILKFE